MVTLTREGFDKALGTIPESTFNEIWCSEVGLEKLKKYIQVPGTSVYKSIDYLSYVVTPIRVRDYLADDKVFLMKKATTKCAGTVVTESCRIVQVIKIVEE